MKQQRGVAGQQQLSQSNSTPGAFYNSGGTNSNHDSNVSSQQQYAQTSSQSSQMNSLSKILRPN